MGADQNGGDSCNKLASLLYDPSCLVTLKSRVDLNKAPGGGQLFPLFLLTMPLKLPWDALKLLNDSYISHLYYYLLSLKHARVIDAVDIFRPNFNNITVTRICEPETNCMILIKSKRLIEKYTKHNRLLTGELVREEYDRRVEDVGGEKYEYERAIVTREQVDEMSSRRRQGGCGKARDPCPRRGGGGGGGRMRGGDDMDCGGARRIPRTPQPPFRDPCRKDDDPALPNTDEQLAKVEEKFSALEKQLKESCDQLNSGLCKVQSCMSEGFQTINGKMKEMEKNTDKTIQAIDDQIRAAEEDLNKNIRVLSNDIAETQETFCRNLDKAKRDVDKMEKFFKREICETIRDLKTSSC